jgi:RNA polymerase sigma-70 factor (ECF subfamily)
MSIANRARVDTDADLVAALRREEASAMDQLVERYADRVYRLAVRITGSREDAEEVVQDVLWTVGRKINTFKGDSAFGSWIYRIAANAAYMKLRARRGKGREIALDEVMPALDSGGLHFEAVDDWSPRVDDRALQGELRSVLESAIGDLPPDYRTALVLHDIEGVSNPDIADTLGISLPAVKSRVHRSRLFLRKRLSEYLNDGATPA